jgi:hypothetical protein
MGNIVGEPFKDYVKTQINKRQEIHGKKTRDSTEISYLNSRTSWIKLVSGTKIEMERLNMLPNLSETQKQALTGLGLAEKFVLFNGTTSINQSWDEKKMQKARDAGMKMSTKLLEEAGTKIQDAYSKFTPQQKSGFTGADGAYFSGIGNNKYDFGIVPMPGIESVSVKALERGSIKRASIKIKAYNKQQFDIIDILYLRLGYTILLEWGDSHYINNKNGEIEKLRTTLLEKSFFKHGFATSYYDLLDILEKERKNYSGCYDGLIGKITNFKWTFNPDGTYDINLDVISLGDVIESLKLNIVPYTLLSEKQSEAENKEGGADLIDSSRDDNELSRMFYNIKVNSIQEEEGYFPGAADAINSTINVGVQTTRPLYNKTFPKIKVGRGVRIPKSYEFIVENTILPEKLKLSEYVQIGFKQKSYQWYIRFGNLLESINKLLIHNLKSDTGQKFTTLKIDSNPETNIMYFMPNMVSIDPKVCIIENLEVQKPEGYVDKIFGGLNSFKRNFKGNNSSYGNIMNIYVNMNHVLELLNQVDKDGNIIFMDFLRNLCSNINKALGSVNKLEPKVDPDTNIIKIFDQTPLPNKDKLPPGIFPTGSIESTLELYGYNNQNNTSNFIHNIGLTTEVTPEFATMITVGATADGYVVGEESTAFSKWNNGIIDRFKESLEFDIIPSGSISEKYLTIAANYFTLLRKTVSTEYATIENWYSYAGIRLNDAFWFTRNDNVETYGDINQLQKDSYGGIIALDLDEKNITANYKIIPEYYKLIQAEAVQRAEDKNKSSGQTGFLPFNLQIDMDGISGMKIYQKLEVDSRFLPTNYPEKLEFVTTNIDHELKNNKWITKLNTIATVSNLLSTTEIVNSLKIDLGATKELLQTMGKIDDVFRIRYKDDPDTVPNPGTNRNPIIIQNKSQKVKYQKLYAKQFGNTSTTYANFDNFVIRKGDDPNSYAMKFIKFLGERDSRIKIKGASNKKPGELGNGADISEKLYNVLVNKLHPESMKEKYSSISRDIVITAGNDVFHQGKTLSSSARYPRSNVTPANTTHTRGLALDLRSTGDITKDNLIIEMLYTSGFGGILYHDPPHIHANINPR